MIHFFCVPSWRCFIVSVVFTLVFWAGCLWLLFCVLCWCFLVWLGGVGVVLGGSALRVVSWF